MSKKKFIIVSILSLVVVACAATLVVSYVKKTKEDRTVRVAFYGLSEEYCTLLQEYIPVEDKINLVCDILSEDSTDLSTIKNKYDMLFTWKGEITDALEKSSDEIPAKILETVPRSLRNNKCMPILLDHYELAYSKNVINQLDNNIPTSFSAFVEYLEDAKPYVFSPFFCNGGNDRIVAALVGSIILANGGKPAYINFIEELRSGTEFDTLLDVDLGKGLTLRYVLETLKTWPEKGYIHPAWYNANGSDLLYFADTNQIGVFFTSLQEHREIPYDIISRFESFLMAPTYSSLEYGIIAPAISVMLISDNANAKRYIEAFFTEQAQEQLSYKTKLAPVNSRTQAYDRQADDVRFWAASCPAGALPDVYLAAFQRKPEALKQFSESVRNFVK